MMANANEEAAVEVLGVRNDDLSRHNQDEAEQVQQPLPDASHNTRHPDDPSRMYLSPEERQWALEIKDIVESTPELDNLSDFFYVQVALVEQGDLEAALTRIAKLQELRHEYGIVEDDYEFAKRGLQEGFHQNPKWLINIAFHADDGTYVTVFDLKEFRADIFKKSPRKEQIFQRGCYLWQHVPCPDFEAIRKGSTVMLECEGHSMTQGGMDLKTFRATLDIATAYPIHVQKFVHVHTGVFTNLMVSMGKRFLPRDVAAKFVMGVQAENRLDELFMTPDFDTAFARNWSRIDDSLKRRFHHIKTFSLTASSMEAKHA